MSKQSRKVHRAIRRLESRQRRDLIDLKRELIRAVSVMLGEHLPTPEREEAEP